MPTYEYKCGACGRTLEEFQSIKAKPLRRCPFCGKNALERLIGTGGAVLFKGSGFYQTDYRGESYRKAAQADKPGDAKAGDSKPSDAKAGAQPSATPEPKPSTPAAPTPEKPKSASRRKSAKE